MIGCLSGRVRVRVRVARPKPSASRPASLPASPRGRAPPTPTTLPRVWEVSCACDSVRRVPEIVGPVVSAAFFKTVKTPDREQRAAWSL